MRLPAYLQRSRYATAPAPRLALPTKRAIATGRATIRDADVIRLLSVHDAGLCDLVPSRTHLRARPVGVSPAALLVPEGPWPAHPTRTRALGSQSSQRSSPVSGSAPA